MNILEEIAGKTRERIGQEKGKVSVAELKERIRDREQNPAILPTPSFYQALKKEGMSYICEVKKASPSKGLIAPDFRMWRSQKNMRQRVHRRFPV